MMYWLALIASPREGEVRPPDDRPGWRPVTMTQGTTTSGSFGSLLIAILWERGES